MAQRTSEIDAVRLTDLREIDPGPYAVFSLYLDVDGRTRSLSTIRSTAHSLLHQAREELELRHGELAREAFEAAHVDLEQVRAFLDRFDSRGACRGLALFSCSGRDWSRHYFLPRSVPDRYRWNGRPLILPALRLLQSHPHSGVILVDREQGRFFTSRLGEVEEQACQRDNVHRRVHAAGWYGLEERRIERHIDDQLRRHLEHVAAAGEDLFRDQELTWLFVGGNAQLLEEFRHTLPLPLRERWARDLALPANAPLERVQEAVIAAEEELLRDRETALLQRLYAEWRAGGHGVVGIEETLRALPRDAVESLIIDAGLQLPGQKCVKCGALGQKTTVSLTDTGARCATCGSETLHAVPDLIEVALETAVSRGGEVHLVGHHEEFQRDGGMGALLRFRAQ